MKKLSLILSFFLLISLASATWWCGGEEYNDCASSYPKECCVSHPGIPVCLYQNQDCGESCCVGGGCDSWDDYWFCNTGEVANCINQELHCCSSEYPIYNEQTQTCWKVGWECTMQEHCSSDERCVNHICVEDPCKNVDCYDGCEDSVRFFNGYCSEGNCIFEEEICASGCLGDFCAEDKCIGVLCNDKCEDSILYYGGVCNSLTGQCQYNTEECEFGCTDERCRTNPCEGVVCEDYCSENSLFYDGKCINGKCIQFKEKEFAEECGFVSWYEKTWFQITAGVVVLLVLLFGFAMFRSRRKR